MGAQTPLVVAARRDCAQLPSSTGACSVPADQWTSGPAEALVMSIAGADMVTSLSRRCAAFTSSCSRPMCMEKQRGGFKRTKLQ